jgi:hypothetical protein
VLLLAPFYFTTLDLSAAENKEGEGIEVFEEDSQGTLLIKANHLLMHP